MLASATEPNAIPADDRHRPPPAPPVSPQIAQGVQSHAEEPVHRRLKVPGQKHAPARETAQRRIAHSRAVGRAPVGQKQPRKPCRRGENPDVRTVLREKPGKTVGQRAQRRRAAIRHQPPQEKIRSQARQQGVERQLQLNRPRGDAGQEERPVRRIPGTHLRIGQQRIAGKQIGRPEGKARPEPVRHVLLQRVMQVRRIPLDGGGARSERHPIEDDHGQHDQRRPEPGRVGLRPAPRAGGALCLLPPFHRGTTARPPCSLLFCAASRNAKISSVSSFDTGGLPVSKNFAISRTSGR